MDFYKAVSRFSSKKNLDVSKMSKIKLLHVTKINEKAMHTSYLISCRIANTGKLHTIREALVRPGTMDAVQVMF